MNPYYRDYSEFLGEHFDTKVQKLTVDAGFTCPNRNGTVGYGGCIYCNNASFSPSTGGGEGEEKRADRKGDAEQEEKMIRRTGRQRSVARQIADGKRFFGKKYPEMRYLAYFQSYTSTHGDIGRLLELYREALDQKDVVGLIIGTRPDCMPDRLIGELKKLMDERQRPVIIEFGAESTHDSTLAAINRCHTWATTVDAVTRVKAAGLSAVGLHFILGLPGEDREMMLESVRRLNALPVDTVKFHQLQIIRSTRLAADYEAGRADMHIFDVDEYIDLCVDIINILRRDIAIERFVSSSPADLLIAPKWGLKNYEFTHRLLRRLEGRTGINNVSKI